MPRWSPWQLIIGGGIFLASGGDDKKNEASDSAGPTGEGKGGEDSGIGGGGKEKVPANTKSTVAFQLPEPKVGDVTTVDGSWLTDKAYVKTGVDEIVGYDKVKGTKLWSIPLEGQLCAASRHMSKDYKTAIVFEEGKPTKAKKYPPCNQVGGIDLNTGKLMWSKPVTAATSGDEPVRFDEVTLSGTTVAAGGTEGGAAFDLNTGAERWKPKVGTDGCYDKGYGGGDALAVVRKCGTYDSPQLVIQALNPTTGAPLSSFKMPPGVDYASIVSTKPLVVAADVGDTAGDGSGISDFFSIDASTGKLLTKIAADGEKYAARCGSTEVETCQQLAVGNNRLYLPTEEHEGTGEYGDTNEIVSFDLTTGKPTSDKADAGDRYTMFPIRMDGSNIIAYKVPPYDKGGQIVSIDGSTFKQTVLMENPGDESVRDAETSFSMDYAEYPLLGRPDVHLRGDGEQAARELPRRQAVPRGLVRHRLTPARVRARTTALPVDHSTGRAGRFLPAHRSLPPAYCRSTGPEQHIIRHSGGLLPGKGRATSNKRVACRVRRAGGPGSAGWGVLDGRAAHGGR